MTGDPLLLCSVYHRVNHGNMNTKGINIIYSSSERRHCKLFHPFGIIRYLKLSLFVYFWKLLETFENFWKLLETFGIFWNLMEMMIKFEFEVWHCLQTTTGYCLIQIPIQNKYLKFGYKGLVSRMINWKHGQGTHSSRTIPSWEGPGMGRNRTGQDLETLKVNNVTPRGTFTKIYSTSRGWCLFGWWCCALADSLSCE